MFCVARPSPFVSATLWSFRIGFPFHGSSSHYEYSIHCQWGSEVNVSPFPLLHVCSDPLRNCPPPQPLVPHEPGGRPRPAILALRLQRRTDTLDLPRLPLVERRFSTRVPKPGYSKTRIYRRYRRSRGQSTGGNGGRWGEQACLRAGG